MGVFITLNSRSELWSRSWLYRRLGHSQLPSSWGWLCSPTQLLPVNQAVGQSLHLLLFIHRNTQCQSSLLSLLPLSGSSLERKSLEYPSHGWVLDRGPSRKNSNTSIEEGQVHTGSTLVPGRGSQGRGSMALCPGEGVFYKPSSPNVHLCSNFLGTCALSPHLLSDVTR